MNSDPQIKSGLWIETLGISEMVLLAPCRIAPEFYGSGMLMLHGYHPWISLATCLRALPRSSVMVPMREVSYQRSPNRVPILGRALELEVLVWCPSQDYVVR